MTAIEPFRILIVEDQPEVRGGLQEFFEIEGYDVFEAEDGEAAMRTLRERQDLDLVLLDVMLPGMNGFDVLASTRAQGITPPVIMLTALHDREKVLRGFELGVEDYVTKPFNAMELGARVRAVLRRRKRPSEAPMDVQRIGDVVVNFSTHEASRGGEAIHFTVLEFDLLRYLLYHEGETVTREQLLNDVWDVPGDLHTRTVDRHIASLRKKIEPSRGAPEHIRTIYGVGYQMTR